MPIKSGFKSTEFWTTLIQALIGPVIMVLVAAGIFLPETDQEGLRQSLSGDMHSIVQGAIAIVANIMSVSATKTYLAERTHLKVSAIASETEEVE